MTKILLKKILYSICFEFNNGFCQKFKKRLVKNEGEDRFLMK